MDLYCCDPLGYHKDNPLKVTKKTKKSFRVITEELAKKITLQLKPGDYLCSKCRPDILRNHVLDTGKAPEDNSRKVVTCKNPFECHNTKRQGPGQKFYKCTYDLAAKCESKGLQVGAGDPLCFQCRIKVMEATGDNFLGKYCADPREKHSNMRSNSVLYALKNVTEEDIARAHSLSFTLREGEYLCMSCRLYLKSKGKIPELGVEAQEIEGEIQQDSAEEMSLAREPSDDEMEHEPIDAFDPAFENHRVDSYYQLMHVSRILKVPLPSQTCLQEQDNSLGFFHSVASKITTAIIQAGGRKVHLGGENCPTCREHVESLVKRYQHLEEKSEKFHLLTAVPTWVSVNGLQNKFSIKRSMAQKVSILRSNPGPISCPPPKHGRALDSKTIEEVKLFYLSPENSRVCPNQRDVIIIERKRVANEIVKVRAARQELMMPLKQLYREFKLTHPQMKISASKFAQLRPKQCVWANKKGFQQTCVCATHCNFENLLTAIKLPDDTGSQLTKFFCSVDHDCLMGICPRCPNWTALESIVEEHADDIIEAWQWLYGGEGPKTIELVRVSWPKEDFLTKFKVEALKTAEHHFIYMSQKKFIRELKIFSNKDDTKGVLLVDFGQNYSFVQPVEVQSLHWSHKQATVHPFMLYYYCQQSNEAKFRVYTVISDWLSHNAQSFHAFRSIVINDYIKPQFPNITHLTYVSDRPTSQYCNINNFVNTSHHSTDFGLTADWVFSAASHGKCPVDGMSALAKRLTRLESLRRKDNFILSAADMCHFLSSQHSDEKKYYIFAPEELCRAILDQSGVIERYDLFNSVKGTRQFHFIRPIDQYTLSCKKFAASTDEYTHAINKHPTHYQPPAVKVVSQPSDTPASIYPSLRMEINCELPNTPGPSYLPSAPPIHYDGVKKFRAGCYVAAVLNKKTILGVIMDIDEGELEFKIKIMQKCPKGRSYKFKDPEKIICVLLEDMVCTMPTPVTVTGRTYEFDQDSIVNAQSRSCSFSSSLN